MFKGVNKDDVRDEIAAWRWILMTTEGKVHIKLLSKGEIFFIKLLSVPYSNKLWLWSFLRSDLRL